MRRFPHQAVFVAVVAQLLTSTIVNAQFGGTRAARRASYPENIGLDGPPPIPPTIAALALEHADELALFDTQRVSLLNIRWVQDSTNRPRILKLDSLRPTRRPANGPNDLSQEQRDEMEARRAAITLVLDAMRQTNALTRQRVLGLLTPAQQKRAIQLEEEAQKQADDEIKRRAREPFVGDDQYRRAERLPED